MGASLNFTVDGAADTVNVTSYTAITDLWASGGTYAVWHKVTEDSGNSRLATKYNGSEGWLISYLGGMPRGVRFGHQRADGLQLWTSSTSPITINGWIHIAMTWDGDVSSTPVFYFDGVSDSSSVTTASTGALVDDTGQTFIMNSSTTGGTQNPNGYCAYVQMFNRELSAAEINEIMRRPGGIANGLVCYLPLTDPVTTMRNLTNNNTGTSADAASIADGPPVSVF